MTRAVPSRLALLLSLERTALLSRYVAFVALAPLYLLEFIPGSDADFILITVIVIIRSLFSHVLLYIAREEWLGSRLNFYTYLLEISIVVKFSGGEQSVAFALYLLLIIGYAAQARHPGRVLAVSALCCAAYAIVIAAEYIEVGIYREASGAIAAVMVLILLTGWLAGRSTEHWGQIENENAGLTRALTTADLISRAILNSIPDAVILYDEYGFIVEANSLAGTLSGVPPEQLRGKHIETLSFREGTLLAPIIQMRASGESTRDETIVNPQGENRRVRVIMRPYEHEGRRCCATVACDITDMHRAQQRARRTAAELDRLTKELDHAATFNTDLLKTLSNRIKSPLTALLGYLDLLLTEELGPLMPEQEDALKSCRRSAVKILSALEDSPPVARVSSMKSPPFEP